MSREETAGEITHSLRRILHHAYTHNQAKNCHYDTDRVHTDVVLLAGLAVVLLLYAAVGQVLHKPHILAEPLNLVVGDVCDWLADSGEQTVNMGLDRLHILI